MHIHNVILVLSDRERKTNQTEEIKMANEIVGYKFSQDFSNILGAKIVGNDGYGENEGYVIKVSMQNHSVLGVLVQIWIKWSYSDVLEPFFPRQFNKYFSGSKPTGIYVIQD